MKRIIYLVCASAMLVAGCKKEETEDVLVVDPSTNINWDVWQPVESIDERSRFITNIQATETALLLGTDNSVMWYYPDGSVQRYLAQGTHRHRRPFSEKYSAYYSDRSWFLRIFRLDQIAIDGPVSIAAQNSFRFSEYWKLNEFAAFNESETQLLLAAHPDSVFFGSVHYALVNFKEGHLRLEIESEQVFEVTSPDLNFNNLHSSYVTSHQDAFYISYGYGLLKIYPDGSHRFVIGPRADVRVQQVLEYDNTLLALARDQIFRSTDGGETWSEAYTSSETMQNLDFFVVGDELLATDDDLIGHVVFSDRGFIIRTVQSAGLENHFITGIAMFKGMVYVSTTSGTFRKPVEQVLEYVE